MRYVNRDEIEIPGFFYDKEVQTFNEEIKDYLKDKDFRRVSIEKTLLNKMNNNSSVREALNHLFKGKCAYCETHMLYSSPATIDHFRPKSGAERFNGKIDKKHYTWLAFNWENLYLACSKCNMNKRNLFPVNRAGRLGASISILRSTEHAFLLDPCWDKPEKHLMIALDGRLFPLSERGQVTINLLELNRNSLVSQRTKVLQRFKYFWQQMFNDSLEKPNSISLHQLMHPDEPYSGSILLLLKQILRYIGQPGKKFLTTENVSIPSLLSLLVEFGPINLEDAIKKVSSNSFELEKEIREPYYIKNIQIHNFKGINDCYLEFPENKKDFASCKVLIGANTIGKTTILQAIALGILGPSKAHEIYPDARECLSSINEEGSIKVEFWGQNKNNLITYSKRSSSFFGNINTSALLLGYGAYRLPAKRQLSKRKRQDNYRVLSLFDARELINGPIGLLKRHHGKKVAEDIAGTINEILLGEEAEIRFDQKNGLRIFHNNQEHKLEHFSSGYQSIISFVTDIMDVLYTRWNSMLGAQGIVLIDELDAHLHPSWRFKIVSALRKTFPRVQFILSTHDPLILRGADSEEITILKRDENGVVTDTKSIPDTMNGLNIDQLLTSVFGLQNTMKPELENLFSEYYYLLSKNKNDLSDDDMKRLSHLQNKLSNLKVFGTTKRERLMYHLIDQELAQKSADYAYEEWSEDSVKEVAGRILEKMSLKRND